VVKGSMIRAKNHRSCYYRDLVSIVVITFEPIIGQIPLPLSPREREGYFLWDNRQDKD
jgi:hypothetical protein